ncbi:MAG: DUF6263 family protein [Planctomycetota bacterium]|nr:DUF6263 family protein [Planctomycetota bacterium]
MQVSSKYFVLVAFVLSASGGCGSADSGSTDPDLVSDLLGPEDDAPASSQFDREFVDKNDRTESDDRNVRTVSNPAPPGQSKNARNGPVGEKLELRLQLGDRFPLVKTVEQTLLQHSEIAPARARTKLELTLIITVEDVKADEILLGVQYSRVAYQHDVNGRQLLYDSASHHGEVPWDAIPYAGMVNNGFAFWLGRNNSIRALVGYQEFLERCVADVPLARRETLLSEISNRFGDDGVANFVDDTIGLLPYDNTVDEGAATRVMPGDLWTRERRLMQPVPIHLTSTYRLASLSEEFAEIEITGRVAAGEVGTPSDIGRLRIIGGQSVGRCIVDRPTGLPLEMNLSRFIKMQVMTSDNQSVIQEKQIETTIRAFPEMRGKTVGTTRRDAVVQPAVAFGTPSGNVQSIPTQGSTGQAVRAVYPN